MEKRQYRFINWDSIASAFVILFAAWRGQAEVAMQLPTAVVEGSGTLTNAGNVVMGGISVSNMTVNLTSSLPQLIVVPPTISLIAGRSNATFQVMVLDDTIYRPGQTATITATIAGFPGSDT